MKTFALSAEETRQTGYTHRSEIDYTDLTDTAGTTKTLDLLTQLGIGKIVTAAAFYLNTQFASASVTALTMQVGHTAFGVTADPDAFIEAVSLLSGATPILAGDATGVAFATKRTGQAVVQAGGKVQALFTATTANLTALTAGKVNVFFTVADLATLVNPS